MRARRDDALRLQRADEEFPGLGEIRDVETDVIEDHDSSSKRRLNREANGSVNRREALGASGANAGEGVHDPRIGPARVSSRSIFHTLIHASPRFCDEIGIGPRRKASALALRGVTVVGVGETLDAGLDGLAEACGKLGHRERNGLSDPAGKRVG